MHQDDEISPAGARDRGASRVLAPLAGLLAAGATVLAIFLLGRAVGSALHHAALVFATTAIAVVTLWFARARSPRLRTWSIGGILVTLVGALALGALLSRPTSVDEQVVQAPDPADRPARQADQADAPANELLTRGSFEPLEHEGRGTASLIRTSEGRTVLTLTDFRTGAGPDLFVWLVAGNPDDDSDVESGRSVSLGKLKGTSGDQQYELPDGIEPGDFTHVYVWCRAFSVGFTRARLA